MAEYPKRESHFAHKLVRVMLRACAAQEIGTDGALLVTIIAHTEDAKRYVSPVTFWNDQLMSVAGMSRGQLDRARAKAVAGGWLHYEPGGKGRVGKYWATIPEALLMLTDSSVECDLHVIMSKNEQETGREPGENRETNGREPGENRERSEQHSSLYLIPMPTPNTNTPPVVPQGGRVSPANEKPKRARKTSEAYPPEFERFWATYPPIRKQNKPGAAKAWARATEATAAEAILTAAEAFAASRLGRSEYCPGPEPWLNQRRWEDDRRSWDGARHAAAQVQPVADEELPF